MIRANSRLHVRSVSFSSGCVRRGAGRRAERGRTQAVQSHVVALARGLSVRGSCSLHRSAPVARLVTAGFVPKRQKSVGLRSRAAPGAAPDVFLRGKGHRMSPRPFPSMLYLAAGQPGCKSPTCVRCHETSCSARHPLFHCRVARLCLRPRWRRR